MVFYKIALHWILHQSNEQLNPNAKTRAGYEFNKSTEWKWKKKVCDKLSKNLRRFLLTFIVSNVCLCVSFFVWGNKINFIESDAIRPKTKSFRFKTISRLKLVLLLFFSLLFSVCHVFFCSYFIFFSLSLDTRVVRNAAADTHALATVHIWVKLFRSDLWLR